MRTPPHRAALLSTIALATTLAMGVSLLGCAARGPVRTSADSTVGSETGADYPTLFNAARDTLLARGFVLDRVDASAGIITTFPKATAGLATPWDSEQVGLDQELNDLTNPNERRVTVRFVNRDPDTIEVQVDAVIDRVRMPGWRVETESISRSRLSSDPSLVARRMEPRYRTPVTRDDRLASVLLTEVMRRTEEPIDQ